MALSSTKPRIVHVMDRLSVGGMETVAVNLIEHSRDRYDHSVICLRGWSDGRLLARLSVLNVAIQSLDKRPGKDLLAYVRLCRMLRALHADIVHTYNIGAIDAAVCARVAGVPRVVHAEHGRDARDPNGRNAKYRWLRRALSPLISAFVPVSEDLSRWLAKDIGVSNKKIRLIYNGIDVDRYGQRGDGRSVLPAGFAPSGSMIVGTVGRLDPVKAYDVLLTAFAQLVNSRRERGDVPDPRLIIVGDGPEHAALQRRIQELEIASFVWLAGERDDVPRLLQAMDVYVCSSIAEGMALTILEAMGSGLPVIATRVGGNPELVLADETGTLVPASDPDALAQELRTALAQPEMLREQGVAGRKRAQAVFSVDAMVAGYCALYDQLVGISAATVNAG